MKLELTPLVVARGHGQAFSVQSRTGEPCFAGRSWEVSVTSVRDYRDRRRVPSRASGGERLDFSFVPEHDGEYLVGVHPSGTGWPEAAFGECSLYSIRPELAAFHPFKGDLHMHSLYSDGRETPLSMAIRMRGLGMDFAAITDHRVHEPSREAIREATRLGMDLVLLPGEEISYCQGPGHIVAIGTDRGIADQFPLNRKTAGRERLESMENLGSLVEQVCGTVAPEILDAGPREPPGRRLYGFLDGIVKRIREAGGIAILAHPFWSSHGAMDLFRDTLVHALRRGLFDAVELFGGMSFEENMLSLAFYHETRVEGHGLPVVGCSDSHRLEGETTGRIHTVAFAEACSEKGIIDAVRSGRTTACLQAAEGRWIVAGRYDLVELTQFLLRELFPRHDALCARLGALYRSAMVDPGRDPRLDPRLDSGETRSGLQEELRSLRQRCLGETARSGLGEAATARDGQGG